MKPRQQMARLALSQRLEVRFRHGQRAISQLPHDQARTVFRVHDQNQRQLPRQVVFGVHMMVHLWNHITLQEI